MGASPIPSQPHVRYLTSRPQIVQSLASAPRKARKFVKHRRAASDATISTTSLATILLVPEPKSPLKANEASQVVHDVLLPSET